MFKKFGYARLAVVAFILIVVAAAIIVWRAGVGDTPPNSYTQAVEVVGPLENELARTGAKKACTTPTAEAAADGAVGLYHSYYEIQAPRDRAIALVTSAAKAAGFDLTQANVADSSKITNTHPVADELLSDWYYGTNQSKKLRVVINLENRGSYTVGHTVCGTKTPVQIFSSNEVTAAAIYIESPDATIEE